MRNSRWYLLIGLVAILGIIGIVYWLYKSDRRVTRIFSPRQPATTDEL